MKSFISVLSTMLLLQSGGTALLAQTTVGGDILVNTTWSLAGSPYTATADVRVVQGVTLQVDPGVIVRFAAGTAIDVEGRLELSGTATDSVLFSTNVPQPDTGSWAGIRVHGSTGGSVAIQFARITYASSALSLVGTGSPGALQLQNSEIRFCATGLRDWAGQPATVRDCGFKENHIAIRQSDLALRHCAFAANQVGVWMGSSDIDSCTFSKHTGPALSGGGGSIRASLFVSNTIGLLLYGFSPNDSVNGCQFAENDTAAVATGSGATFLENEFCANTLNVRVEGSTNPDFARNCWCSVDTGLIATTFIDGRTNAALGTVLIAPIDTSCQVVAQVWPGDANDDGVATITDALYIGVAYGSNGPRRAEATASWTGQTGLPWALDFDLGPNYKHADCDGDGIVSLSDTLPIVQNLGQVHYKASGTSGHGGIPVIFTMPATANASDTIAIRVDIGDAQHSADNIYGLSFVVQPDSQVFRPQSATDLTGTWLGTPGQDLIDLHINNGRVHWAIVRNDQVDVSGRGRAGGVTLLLIDDLTRAIPVDSVIQVQDVVLIDKKGNPLPVDVQLVFEHPCAGQVTVCPTIAQGRIQVLLDTLTATAVELYDQSGHLAYRAAGPLTGAHEIDASTLQPGMYLVRVLVGNGSLHRKVFVMR